MNPDSHHAPTEPLTPPPGKEPPFHLPPPPLPPLMLPRTTDPQPPDGPPTDYPRRFSWPMRLFLGYLAFDVIFRSMMVLYLEEIQEWSEALNLRRRPYHPLPTWETVAAASKPLPDDVPEAGYAITPQGAIGFQLRMDQLRQPPGRVGIEYYATADALWEYFKPFPDYYVRRKLHTTSDFGKFALCWTYTRMDFLGTLMGFEQSWQMFSPGPRKEFHCCRIQLVYEDGSEFTVRQVADPVDPTRFGHWFQEKVLDYEGKAHWYSGSNTLKGYCNLLQHRYPDQNGSPLVRIRLRTAVYYPYPTPRLSPFTAEYHPIPEGTVSPHEWWRAQQGPPDHQMSPVFFEYDVLKQEIVFHRNPWK